MPNVPACAKVNPSSGCTHVVRRKDRKTILGNAAEHAEQHGIREVTPELMAKVKKRSETSSRTAGPLW